MNKKEQLNECKRGGVLLIAHYRNSGIRIERVRKQSAS